MKFGLENSYFVSRDLLVTRFKGGKLGFGITWIDSP